MNEFRVIPIMLLSEQGLVKTTNFKKPNYLGDPINALKIFNEKEVDEIVIVDIDQSRIKGDLDYKWIHEIVTEAFMPVTFGGNIDTIQKAEKIFRLGVEKVIINSNLENFDLINKISNSYGNQSVVISIDYKYNFFGKPEVYINAGRKKIKYSIDDIIFKVIESGAGEILLQNLSLEGSMKGLDLDFVNNLAKKINVPVLISGGCSGYQNIKEAQENKFISGVVGGSVFVYKGRQKGILINYEK